MKKVLFLMILLFLIILGTASVKAQVRIGGNEAPHTAALLDLNPADTTNYGKLGLSLPRVSLASETAQLNGVNPKDGTLVYNTNSSLGEGLYYWVAGKWVKLSGGSGGEALNVTPELDIDYTATAANDIILFTTTQGRRLTLPTTGITVGKKLYISDMGYNGVSLYPNNALRDTNNSVVWPGFPVTIIYIGNGKWQVLNVLY